MDSRTTWVTSDIHFFHKRIIEFCPESRGSCLTIPEMHESIIYRHNSVVGKNDLVYIIGDVTFGAMKASVQLLNEMNGEKILIIGNHDVNNLKRPEFVGCFTSMHDYLEIKRKGDTICMFHYPIAWWNKRRYGSFHLHGHLHGDPSGIAGRIRDVGIDTNDLYPYNLDELIAEMKKDMTHEQSNHH